MNRLGSGSGAGCDSKTQRNQRFKHEGIASLAGKNPFVLSSWYFCVFVVFLLPLPRAANRHAGRLPYGQYLVIWPVAVVPESETLMLIWNW